MATIGSIVKNRRQSKKLTRPQLAKKLKISAGYLAHVENDMGVWLSQELLAKLQKSLSIRFPPKALKKAQKVVKRRYKKYAA